MPFSFTPAEFALTLGIQDDGETWKRFVLVDSPRFDAQVSELLAAPKSDLSGRGGDASAFFVSLRSIGSVSSAV